MTRVSSSLATDGNPTACRDAHAVIPPSQPALLRWLSREGHWPAVAWLGGIAVGALWIYSGMPMICH
jgi:hypothetical protein